MTHNLTPYILHSEIRDSYVYVRVTESMDDLAAVAPFAFIEGAARRFVRHDCSCMLVENQIGEPFAVWDAVAIAPRLGRHVEGCIKIAVVETKSEKSGQTELKIHLSGDDEMTVRVFETIAEAEAWFAE
ncbi:MAG: hypothetical protein ABJA02_08655 [Acidobacteriota bacterium]